MDQGLQDIFAAYGAQLSSIQLYKGEKRLVVEVSAPRFLTHAQLQQMYRQLADMMRECKVEMQFVFPNAQAQLQTDFAACAQVFEASWREVVPTVRALLSGANWALDGEQIRIGVAEKFCTMPGLAADVRAFEALLSQTYGLNLKVRVEADESVAPPELEAAPAKAIRAKPKAEAKKSDYSVVLGRAIRPASVIRQCDVQENAGNVTIAGTIRSLEVTDRKDGGKIVVVVITDRTDTLPAKLFLDAQQGAVLAKLTACKEQGERLVVSGRYAMDMWLRRMCVYPNDVGITPALVREDKAEHKRVELHLHTKMSSMDAVVEVADAVKLAARWGHKAVAITDHGVAQAFPAAVSAADKLRKGGVDIKAILGVEGYLQPDCRLISPEQAYVAVSATVRAGIKQSYVFMLSATAFTLAGVEQSVSFVVNPGVVVPQEVTDATGLTERDMESALRPDEALRQLFAFAKGRVMVFHGDELPKLLEQTCDVFDLPFEGEYVDTRLLFGYLCREQALPELSADAREAAVQTAELLVRLSLQMQERGVENIPLMFARPETHKKGTRSNHHIILLAKSHEGLLNLYQLISFSHLEHLRRVPRIPKSLLAMHRGGLIIGSACEAGELFHAVLEQAPEAELERIAQLYDYFEIQPIGNNAFLVRNERVADEEGLRQLNRDIVALGERLNKPVVATCDVHFLDPEDAVYRAILMSARDFKDAEQQAPLYFRTTDEMLQEFAYLGEEKAYEVVVQNPNAIADACERMPPFLSEKGTYAPMLEGASETLGTLAQESAHALYGEVLPEMVQKRLDQELSSIVGNGYASLYLMAQRLVQKSMSDGYLVGSRGSVGSSLVAYLVGITEVNALQAHYVCPGCHHSNFERAGDAYACGIDMPDEVCPVCGAKYEKLGYNIPFEVFLGFKGDKTPDIDLNFSGEYQAVAHKYTEEMFGKGHAFRAGTISGLKEKTVYGYVMKYCEANNLALGKDEIDRLIAGCCGVKRTTGQHPGGIVIVPDEHNVFEFTPVQYPADRADKNTITTHFDFHAMDDRLVKLDILGHDDPTALRMLEDVTGLNPRDIPLDDPDTLRLFSSEEPLGVSLEALECDVGSIAIPEFGTGFVRQMLADTRPATMEELVRISGLSHGTDVWLGNAQELIRSGTATLFECICTRDDIMNYLIAHGCEPSASFNIMENVRKGRGLTAQMEQEMNQNAIPRWYIDACKRIKYLFPRSHAAAYVMMAFRIAYFKVHMPLAFYAVYYSVRADAFDIQAASGGTGQVLKTIRELRKKGNDIEPKEADLLVILEVVYEMNLRGIELLPVDLAKSDAVRFTVEEGKIRPPFSSVAGVGRNAAEDIAKAGRDGPYVSVEDFRIRTKANSGVIRALTEAGCLEGLPETNQISLF